jgi:hypothetical protein
MPEEYIAYYKKYKQAADKEVKKSMFRMTERYDFAILKLKQEIRRDKYFILYPDLAKPK